jgi:hypothetical protein
MARFRTGWVWLAVLLISRIAIAGNTEDTMVLRYASPPGHAFLHVYKVELLERAMEITRAEFGDYKMEVFSGDNPHDPRRVVLINDGQLVNLLWAPSGSAVTKAEVFEIPTDVLNGLLGYRVCLRNANVPSKLTGINNLQDLKKIRIGQGEEWPDVKIYKENGIHPVVGPSLNSLFEMLGYKRFDCLPFGANEAAYILSQRKDQYPFLELDDQLLIYYEFSIRFYVSKRYPRIAERLKLGLKKLQDSGEFTVIFKKHHAADLKKLNLKNRKPICLKSPYVDNPNQCEGPITYPEEWL